MAAEELIEQRVSIIEGIAKSLEASTEDVVDKISGLINELGREKKLNRSLLQEMANEEAKSLLKRVEIVSGINLLVSTVRLSNLERMREMSDFIREKLKSVIVVLGGIFADKPFFIAAVTPDLVQKGYNAGNIVKKVSQVTGGGGGGRADFAQGSGKYADKLEEALRLVKDLI
jgi:alanyl-tRNA synthetase